MRDEHERNRLAQSRELRQVRESISWINTARRDRILEDPGGRRRLTSEYEALGDLREFAESYRLANATHECTDGHSEQRLLVSNRWSEIRRAMLTHVATAVQRSPGTSWEIVAQNIEPLKVSISINRSPCFACNAYLVAELVALFQEIAGLLGAPTERLVEGPRRPR